MDSYVSHYTNRLDAKGRVSIPASFRAVLARDGFDGLYVHPSIDQEALDCGGHALLREIDGLLSGYSPYSEERDLFSTALIGIERDPESRFGRAGDPDRKPEELRRYLRRSHLRRTSDTSFRSGSRVVFARIMEEARNRVRDPAKTARVQRRRGGYAALRSHGARE